MIETATPSVKVWTEEDLAALPDDGFLHEIVNGELVMSPKNNFYHGDMCSRLLAELVHFNRAHRLGAVLDSSTGFWMTNRNCRAPDISFITKARLRSEQFRRHTNRFFPGAPDLAVEILSPHNTRAEITERLKDYFASGTRIAWVIDPVSETVEICHSPSRRRLLGSGADLDGEELLPGFRYPIAGLFEPGEWE